MCSQFLTIMTCLAMLWHSIGGCCWHHEHHDGDAGVAFRTSGEMHRPPGMRPHCHLNHQHRDADEDSPKPCDPAQHCTGEDCVYVKSFTPDVTGLFPSQAEFVTLATDLLAAGASASFHSTGRVVFHREELSARHHCALTQSWLL